MHIYALTILSHSYSPLPSPSLPRTSWEGAPPSRWECLPHSPIPQLLLSLMFFMRRRLFPSEVMLRSRGRSEKKIKHNTNCLLFMVTPLLASITTPSSASEPNRIVSSMGRSIAHSTPSIRLFSETFTVLLNPLFPTSIDCSEINSTCHRNPIFYPPERSRPHRNCTTRFRSLQSSTASACCSSESRTVRCSH